uniref:RNA polymerase sigma factor n=1 Tax=Anthoceros angustus TaxID=48387 RepID=A0A6G6D2U5_ANTAG|nr:sigma factor 2A [Anthoceros angustus]
MAQAAIKPATVGSFFHLSDNGCGRWPVGVAAGPQKRASWRFVCCGQDVRVGFPSRRAGGRPVVKVDAVATENWIASDEAVAAAAAEQAMALARAAVKAARDVEALTARTMADFSLDCLDVQEEDEDLIDAFYDSKDILRLRLERARLSEMEKAGAVQTLPDEMDPRLADVDKFDLEWTESDLMALSNMSLLCDQSSLEAAEDACSGSQLDVELDTGKRLEDCESILPEVVVATDSRCSTRENVAVKSSRRKERVMKRERALAKAEKAAAAVATAASSRTKKTSITTDSAGDPVRTYLREIGRSRLLSAAEEVELSQGIQDLMKLEGVKRRLHEQMGREPTVAEWGRAVGMSIRPFENRLNRGQACKDKMVNSNLRLVVSIAKKYQGRGMAFQDLVQVGSIGLIRGAEKFDSTKGFKFSTYAHWWIRQAVTRAIADQSRMIRLPVHLFEVISRINKARKIVAQEHGRPATDAEVAELVGMSVEKLKLILRSTKGTQSMERPIGREGDSTVGELVADTETETPEDVISKRLFKHDLDVVMRTLSVREREVLRLRYGLDDGRMRTLEEIGHVFKVTRERIRQIETKAMRKLRQPDRHKVLLNYLEFASSNGRK